MTVALWSNCPGREMGSCTLLPEHQNQAGKQIQIQIQRDRVSWKRTEFSVPRDCSSKACHKEREKRRIQKPTAPEGEKWVQCTTAYHWSSKMWKGRKTGKQKHCIFLTKFFDKTYDYKSMIIYVWWWLCLIILKKSRTGVEPNLSRKMCLSEKVFDKTITDSEKIRKVYPALI